MIVRGAIVLAVLAASACSPPTVLELPPVEGARTWLVVISGHQLPTLAQVVSPETLFRVRIPDDSTTLVEVLAFRRDLELPLGELVEPADGVPLPEPTAAFTAELSSGAWRAGTASSVARALRIPRADDCPTYSVENELLSSSDRDGLTGMVTIGGGQYAVFMNKLWLVIGRGVTRTLAPLVPDVRAATRDPGQAVWVATEDALWVLSGSDPFTATASRTWSLPPDFDTFSIAVPQPGRVYGLTTDGVLYRTDHSGTAILHRFDAPDSGRRGQVVVDGTGVLAAFGENGTVVRVTEDDHVTPLTLPTLNEGGVAIARFGEYGIVVGTSAGSLRAERLGFEPIVDPLGRSPSGASLRVLEVIDGHLYFGGTTGLFGEVTPRGFICVSPIHAASTVRYIANANGELLLGGRPLQAQASDVQLSRVRQ